ncbi:MAG: dephospho-CoA kinase [Bacteroidetes bacterium]|nr:MAG: dephospho-CoA kinase [Bacteroidota bacterium]
MHLKVGLTGGIGSGKSTVAGIFEVLGIPVYYADQAARRLMNEDPTLKKKISELFGEASYKQGRLDRAFIASQVFGNQEKLKSLNALVHPMTISDANEWMKRQTVPYSVKEAALIFESRTNEYLDYVIGVSAPENLRISRTVRRDHISLDEVLKRMKSQLPEEEKMARCDFVIYNDEISPVIPQVLELHAELLKLAEKDI